MNDDIVVVLEAEAAVLLLARVREFLLKESPLFLVFDNLPKEQVVDQVCLAGLDVGEHDPRDRLIDRKESAMLGAIVPAMSHDIGSAQLLAVMTEAMVHLLDLLLTQGKLFVHRKHWLLERSLPSLQASCYRQQRLRSQYEALAPVEADTIDFFA